MKGLAAIASTVLAALLIAAAPLRADDAAMDAGRAYTQAFRSGETGQLWERFSLQMRDALGTAQALDALRATIAQSHGAEVEILSETVEDMDGFRIYLRTARHERGNAPLVTQWTLGEDDRIEGFFVRPAPQAAASPHMDYRTKAKLRLPFEGEWRVYWGGREIGQNYHAADPGQRFAADFVVAIDGATHSGSGKALEDYHCWNREILAPAAGTVTAVVDGLPDQEIGESDPANPAGNHVVLDLGEGEFLFLAHMRSGSVTVGQGDHVAQGAVLGRCGNSGNTSEPHLHVHLQTTPVLGEGEGLPAFFEDYVADGSEVARGEPRRGQTVAPR